MGFEVDNKNVDWHASDLRVDRVKGGSTYTLNENRNN